MTPKIAHFDFGEDPSNFGDSASVQCSITSGDFPVDIRWLFNGEPLMAYDSISTTKVGKRSSVLTIESVNGQHAGNYTCQVKNIADTVNFTASLVVNGIHSFNNFRFAHYFYFFCFYSHF